jgi:hypothetical protein
MIFLVYIASFIAVVLSIFFICDSYSYSWSDNKKSYIIGSLSLIILIGSILWSVDVANTKPLVQKETTKEIVALKDNMSIEGHGYFLGRGYVNGTLAYIYQSKYDEGVTQMGYLNACDPGLYLYQIDDVTPKIVWTNWEKPYYLGFWFFGDCPFYQNRYKIDIFIPKGSVIDEGFEIDMK